MTGAADDNAASESGGEVIFETVRIGEIQRVAAIHVATGTEVVVQAPAGAALADVRTLALRKLERALAADQTSSPSPNRPGKLV